MREATFPWGFLSAPKLAVHATSTFPAWLWSTDGTRLLWANPGGAAIFGAETSAASVNRSFESDHPAALQIARAAASLSVSGAPRLERLRGFGAGFGRMLTCACARIMLDNTPAILVVAVEPAGPNLTLSDRARRLFEGCAERVAIYSAGGELLYATPTAAKDPADISSLSATGLAGRAEKLGDGANEVRVLRLPESQAAAESPKDIAADTIDLTPIAEAISEAQKAMADERAKCEQAVSPIDDETKPSDSVDQADAKPAIGEDPSRVEIQPVEPVTAPGPSPSPERRHPLRFVWTIDSDNRFSIDPGDFTNVIGPKMTAELNRPWISIASDLNLDPEGEVARAIVSRDTWSGVSIGWPVDDSDEPIKVELAGLPVYDRDRNFRGYRGFGVCRDVARVSTLLALRAEQKRQDNNPQFSTDDVPRSDAAETRPALSLVPASQNVVPFRSPPNDSKATILNPLERNAFQELATKLSARLKSADEVARGEPAPERDEQPAAVTPVSDVPHVAETNEPRVPARETPPAEQSRTKQDRPLLDLLPVGILIYRHEHFFYANRAFLRWSGHDSLQDFTEAGGLDTLFIEPQPDDKGQTLRIAAPDGQNQSVTGHLFSIPWDGSTAMMLAMIDAAPGDHPTPAVTPGSESRELRAILDVTTDGVVTLDRDGKILSANASAERLFGYDSGQLAGLPFTNLFAAESEALARGALYAKAASKPEKSREVAGRTRRGNVLPLLMTVGQIDEAGLTFCAAFQDLSRWKNTERELIGARKQAEAASSAKSDFLAKVSHEIRTPLNAIIGFSDVMMNERFGPIGNERYREYLKDIHGSGTHLVSLVNDLLDLSKIEAGKLDLAFEPVNLNDLTQQTVALMQPQASRERIIIRTSLASELPSVVADARSVRQIVLNLLSNSIKFTGAGGQVILSTARSDHGEAVLRVRDTGIGMSEKDIATALEPFRQLATAARPGSNGTGLGLPLTKALAEANSARFSIKSTVNAGTLVEIVFPAVRAAE